jgi:antitoxin CptB
MKGVMTGSSRTSADLDPRRRRLLYRARHRGTREMDLLMGSFCEAEIGEFSAEEVETFEQLIEVPDRTLYQWIVDPFTTPAGFRSHLLDRLRKSRRHLSPGTHDHR